MLQLKVLINKCLIKETKRLIGTKCECSSSCSGTMVYLALHETKLYPASVTEFTVVPVRRFLWQKHCIRLLQCRKRES